jgi:arginyl-tRNA synthetase
MRQFLRERIESTLRSMEIPDDISPTFEKPRNPEHGDLTTNVAMLAAKQAKTPPAKLARTIVDRLKLDPAMVDRVDIAGPGFINFHFTDNFYREETGAILRTGTEFGRSSPARRMKTQVEFVSANPTGPLTVGHGRGAVYGDTVARLLQWTGHDVTREYYFNNAGRQMRILGESVRLRYLELLGERVEFSDEYYQGEYIREIAAGLKAERGESLRNEPAEGLFKSRAEQVIFEDIKKTLKRLGIVHDVFYNENSLYETGKVAEVIAELRTRGLAYDQDGAVWFKTSALGSEQDKVIVKSSGEPTYRLPDIAYHREKLRRGFDLVIDILGADHVATYPDVLAGLKALGEDPSKVKVLIHQFVTILQDGEVVKMSTRKANFITLDELIDEVGGSSSRAGADVVRYFFLMRGINSHLNFDLKLAKEQSEQNPVYYLQYAHARIASIIRHAEDQGIEWRNATDLSRLNEPEERSLMKLLVTFPDMVESCASAYEPHRLAEYLQEAAGAFHAFYHVHRVVTPDATLTASRLALCLAAKTVIANGCAILGIDAPEKM